MNLKERKIMENLLEKGHNFAKIARLLNVRQYHENTKNLVCKKNTIIGEFIK